MKGKQIPQQDQEVVWRELSNEVVLVSPSDGHIRVLNEVGAQIWRLIDGKRDVAAIEANLLDRYNTSPEQVQHDLQSFLIDLTERGLLSWK